MYIQRQATSSKLFLKIDVEIFQFSDYNFQLQILVCFCFSVSRRNIQYEFTQPSTMSNVHV